MLGRVRAGVGVREVHCHTASLFLCLHLSARRAVKYRHGMPLVGSNRVLHICCAGNACTLFKKQNASTKQHLNTLPSEFVVSHSCCHGEKTKVEHRIVFRRFQRYLETSEMP
ncbi:hypothetical protein CALCODRAFT_265517 [Calocera cornea HHB12733]|uniref:Uncharacterized protein n=1 Tax=Calocera cornea HHB12733 TaxID=1353952 RepID=A0A165GDZ8_9BASI|nr:hypothetical protein CALCODRAFT_265517 [Calocera cornea HHB12733]